MLTDLEKSRVAIDLDDATVEHLICGNGEPGAASRAGYGHDLLKADGCDRLNVHDPPSLRSRPTRGRDREDYEEIIGLPLQLDQFLEQFVAGRDHPGVRLEATLRANHVRELLGEVGVGHLERAAVHGPQTDITGGTDDRQA